MSVQSNRSEHLTWIEQHEDELQSRAHLLSEASEEYSRMCNFPFRFARPFAGHSQDDITAAELHLGVEPARQLFAVRAQHKLLQATGCCLDELLGNDQTDSANLQHPGRAAAAAQRSQQPWKSCDLASLSPGVSASAAEQVPWWDNVEFHPAPQLRVFRANIQSDPWMSDDAESDNDESRAESIPLEHSPPSRHCAHLHHVSQFNEQTREPIINCSSEHQVHGHLKPKDERPCRSPRCDKSFILSLSQSAGGRGGVFATTPNSALKAISDDLLCILESHAPNQQHSHRKRVLVITRQDSECQQLVQLNCGQTENGAIVWMTNKDFEGVAASAAPLPAKKRHSVTANKLQGGSTVVVVSLTHVMNPQNFATRDVLSRMLKCQPTLPTLQCVVAQAKVWLRVRKKLLTNHHESLNVPLVSVVEVPLPANLRRPNSTESKSMVETHHPDESTTARHRGSSRDCSNCRELDPGEASSQISTKSDCAQFNVETHLQYVRQNAQSSSNSIRHQLDTRFKLRSESGLTPSIAKVKSECDAVNQLAADAQKMLALKALCCSQTPKNENTRPVPNLTSTTVNTRIRQVKQKRVRWTPDEDQALVKGLKHHPPKPCANGRTRFQWAAIKKDPRFAHELRHRTNVEMKDRWRNMQIGQLSKLRVTGSN